MHMAFAEDSWYGPKGYETRPDLTTVFRCDLRWYCILGAWRIEHF